MRDPRYLFLWMLAAGMLLGCAAKLDIPRCGDGQLDDGEECDDGTANSDNTADTCRRTCVLPWCGDGVLDTGEACDDGNLSSGDGCSDTCQLDGPACGDGVVDTGEDCDDGEDNSDEIPNACRLDCTLPGCGDGVIDNGETCDDFVSNSDTEPDACRTTCEAAGCGDNVIDTGEACDSSQLGGATCETLGYTGGTVTCHTSGPDACTLDVSLCGSCGNNLCEPGEDHSTCSADCAIIGAACSDAADCGTLPNLTLECFDLGPTVTGGYCTAICTPSDPDPCAAGGGVCVDVNGVHACLFPCTVDADCRESDGYTCEPMGSGTYCLTS